MINRFFALSIFLFFSIAYLNATHYRAGEIRIEPLDENNPLAIRATVITYTKITGASSDADRQEITLCWGDGICSEVPRSNGILEQGELIGNDIKKNEYMMTHIYSEHSIYTLTMTDPNRIGGILNVNYPFSINSSFHIQTDYHTHESSDEPMMNSSPLLLTPPIDFGCVGQTFRHNPGAFDIDGDSLSYRLVTPFEQAATPVQEYLFPNEITPGANNSIEINAVTGEVIWNAPQQVGDYVIAIEVVEWRNGEIIGKTLRDMQISIEECGGLAPELTITTTEFNAKPGDLIEFEVTASTALENGAIRLEAFGGPIILEADAANFEENNQTYTASTITKKFSWQITEEHLRDVFYTIIFKSTDNQFSDDMGIANLKTIIIRVSDQSVANKNVLPLLGVKIYPNPTQDFLYLDFDEKVKSETATIQIHTLTGKLVYHETVTTGEINVKEWSAGSYILTVETEDGRIRRDQFVITK